MERRPRGSHSDGARSRIPECSERRGDPSLRGPPPKGGALRIVCHRDTEALRRSQFFSVSLCLCGDFSVTRSSDYTEAQVTALRVVVQLQPRTHELFTV